MAYFTGLVVWITGGGSGIGRSMALEFARQGAHIVVSGRRKDRLEEVAAEIEAMGKRAMVAPCDVTDETVVNATVDRIVGEFGHLDVAIANAGMAVGGRVEKLTTAEWRRQLDVNVIGAVSTARAALPELRKSGGRMVFVASVMAFLCVPGNAAYSASKFAVRAIGLTLAQELKGTGVSCTTIHPGFVESEINQVDNRGHFDPEREDSRPAFLMWKSEKAAKVIVDAVRRRKREYVFSTHGKVGAFVGAHMPGIAHALLSRGGQKK